MSSPYFMPAEWQPHTRCWMAFPCNPDIWRNGLEVAQRNFADVVRAILEFEPRIMASTLKVEAEVSDLSMDHHNVVSLRISGNLWAQPVPFELLLRTEVDLETGQVEIQEMS